MLSLENHGLIMLGLYEYKDSTNLNELNCEGALSNTTTSNNNELVNFLISTAIMALMHI